ncbi:MAG: helix-turn-helix transcriptional regulator [Clostridiales bacterium]|nr:helix-turn-helix transcriptional regulator [Clostridiales bacterium]
MKLRQLTDERGWTEYRLAKECGLSESTIANIFRRNTTPSVSTLEAICRGFGITLSQFFAEGEMLEMTPEVSELVSQWITLTPDQKRVILDMAKALNNKTE